MRGCAGISALARTSPCDHDAAALPPRLKTAKIVKGAELKVYPGAPHGLAEAEADKFNADVLIFIQT